MNDRELLEMAAKAAGLEVIGEGANTAYLIVQDEDGHSSGWSPLADDGDALRLAVKLEITPSKHDDTVVASRSASWRNGAAHCSLWEPAGDDSYAATRRAIVRAAAAIGKAMP